MKGNIFIEFSDHIDRIYFNYKNNDFDVSSSVFLMICQ